MKTSLVTPAARQNGKPGQLTRYMEDQFRYLLYLAAKNKRYTCLETRDDFAEHTVTVTVTFDSPMTLTPEEAYGLQALQSGVPLEDLIA